MTIFLFHLMLCLCLRTASSDMVIERAQGKGDAIQGVDKIQCDKFSGIWNRNSDTCHCGDGKTLYTLNNKITCFAGIGENIGCKLKIEGYNEVVAFYKKGDDYMNIGNINEQSYGKCQIEVVVWRPNGWRLAKYISVKVSTKQISVGWVKANYTTQVQGQLFKMTFFNCKKNPDQACLLFKNSDGKSRFSTPRVTTQTTSTIANTTSTTVLTQTNSQEKSSSNEIVIALGVCCAILVIVGIISFLLWFRRRKYLGSKDKSCWKWNQIKRSVFKEEEHIENIYEDIGRTKLQEVQKREEKCDDLYLVPLELSNTMRSTMKNSPYTYAQHVEDDETLSGQCYTQPKYDGGELYEEPACEGEYYEEPARAEEYYEDPANNDLYEEPGMTSEERYSALAEDDTSIKKDYCTLRKDDIYEEADSTHMPAQPIYFETEPEI
ncbi:uncharacterized protein LOC130654370 [Hydractinia symbiolongicarpus]|uniref:uncharacterized protein LOC130654370 n=1 Tax=Hydractinia symbiolongicarpus TaxID=13093 RepID=UPI00254A919E|nr:uncharacterized protein LOC130654370 [Hydractinia symbiolongicarpus]